MIWPSCSSPSVDITPLHSHTSLAKVDRFGKVSAFIPNTSPSPLVSKVGYNKAGTRREPINPRYHLVKYSDVPASRLHGGAWHWRAPSTWMVRAPGMHDPKGDTFPAPATASLFL